jgi:hypothetical protein
MANPLLLCRKRGRGRTAAALPSRYRRRLDPLLFSGLATAWLLLQADINNAVVGGMMTANLPHAAK